MSTISTANVLADKATGACAKKKSGKTPNSSARVANTPNAETLAAFAEAEAGDVKRFKTLEEFMADLDNADE